MEIKEQEINFAVVLKLNLFQPKNNQDNRNQVASSLFPYK